MVKKIKVTVVSILALGYLAFILYWLRASAGGGEELLLQSQAYITIATLITAAVFFMLEVIPIAVTAMFIPVALTLTGILDSAQAFNTLGNSTIVLFGGMFVIGAAMFETGLAGVIGNRVIQLSKGSEIKLTLGVILVATALSSVLSNTGTVAVLLPVCLGISDAAGWNRGRLLMPLAIMASVGGMISLVGTPPNITVNATLQQFGQREFGFFEYAAFGLPMSLIATCYLLTIGRRLLPNRPPLPVSQTEPGQEDSRNKRHQIIAGGILLLVVVVMATELIPLHVAAVAGALTCIITGVIDEKKAYRSIDWQTIFLFAGALSLSTALEQTGAGAMIAEAIVGVTGSDVHPYVLLTVMFWISAVLTQFMSNTASAALLAPIGFQIASSLSLDPHPIMMAIAVSASAAFVTPVATPPNTLVYGPGNFRFLDYVKIGLPLLLITYIAAVVIIPLVWPF